MYSRVIQPNLILSNHHGQITNPQKAPACTSTSPFRPLFDLFVSHKVNTAPATPPSSTFAFPAPSDGSVSHHVEKHPRTTFRCRSLRTVDLTARCHGAGRNLAGLVALLEPDGVRPDAVPTVARDAERRAVVWGALIVQREREERSRWGRLARKIREMMKGEKL